MKVKILRMPDGGDGGAAGGASGAAGGSGGASGAAGGSGGAGAGSLLGGAAGAANKGAADGDWRASIPEDIRGHPSLINFKDVGSLAKSWVSVQSLVGAEKIVKPKADWGKEQWDDFYKQLGRPETPDGYKFDISGIKDFKVDEGKLSEAKKALHEAGLTQSQVEKVMGYYFNETSTQLKAHNEALTLDRTKSMEQLKKQWGDDTPVKIDLAKAVLQRFGSKDALQAFDDPKYGDNPHIIHLLATIGESLMEDSASGRSSNLLITDVSQAHAEIQNLKSDQNFMKALSDRGNVGHDAAVDRWMRLHEQAFPKKK